MGQAVEFTSGESITVTEVMKILILTTSLMK